MLKMRFDEVGRCQADIQKGETEKEAEGTSDGSDDCSEIEENVFL
jgi:hypothetical protein